jgi:hypothetical protein
MEAAKLDMDTENSILPAGETQPFTELMPEPLVQTADPELVVARGSEPEPLSQTVEPLTSAEPITVTAESTAPEPLRKQEWI